MNFKPPLAAAMMGAMVSNSAISGDVANPARMHGLGLQGGAFIEFSNDRTKVRVPGR